MENHPIHYGRRRLRREICWEREFRTPHLCPTKKSLVTGKEKYTYYENHQVNLLMPGYIKAALQRFNRTIPTKRQDSPFTHILPNYGAKIKYAKGPDETQLLNKKGKNFIQRISVNLLYLNRAVDITILNPLSPISSQQ